MAGLTLFKKSNQPPPVSFSHVLNDQSIEITVKGAVRKPGDYKLKKGDVIQDALSLAEPLLEANLDKIKLESKLRQRQIINVPSYSYITITIEGAVTEPKSLTVKLGTMAKDLVELLTFLPEADKEKLNKKRRLKDKEIIVVPVKKKNKSV